MITAILAVVIGMVLMAVGTAVAAGEDMGYSQDFARPLALVGFVSFVGGALVLIDKIVSALL